MKKILVVDDDDHLRMVLDETLTANGYEVQTASSGQKALDLIKEQPFDLVITDLMMPGIKGIELLEQSKQINPDVGFMVISAYGTIETAVDAMKKGSFDFITKPFSITQIETRVKHYFEYRALQEENKNLKRRLQKSELETRLIGNSPKMQEVLYHIDVVAKSDATVFIRGESGTGKELIAKAIHDNSDRADRPFLKINCAAVPDTLFESTLFGHEKGAFSGAYKSKKGIFEECDGGTLLMDEISEMPYNMQAKLLRVLQEMRVTRVGSNVEIPVDVRIIATTNRDIEQLVEEQKFREDLFFRLNVFPIMVPPLRKRREDIPLLVNYFVERFRKKYKFKQKTVTPEVLDRLVSYDWPGNVRQLEHVIERAVLYSGRDEFVTEKYFILEMENRKRARSDADEGVLPLAEMERRMIFKALEQTNHHRTRAAELLGITVRTLRNKLHQFEQEGFVEVKED